ncbi:hypothetical protein AB0M80_43020 [Amycolatopsis sp. NPDC051045]|uniref:hypothetical protein n=1 Tax=Amycolatopsis sp. NPDC051045 TaxID=3156922 RepID=UPI003439A4CC
MTAIDARVEAPPRLSPSTSSCRRSGPSPGTGLAVAAVCGLVFAAIIATMLHVP